MSNALGEIVGEIERLKRQVERLSTLEDAPAPWTDYSATSTVTGWSSYTTKAISYSRVGNLVYVAFFISGTSNSATTSFTLPHTSALGLTLYVSLGRAMDNGAYLDKGMMGLSNGAAVVNCYTAMAGTAFTASGSKVVAGEFWYVTS